MTRDPADEHSADPTTLPQSGRLLALDVGDRRIGLAVSIPPGSLILPAGHIRRRNRRADIAAILDAANTRDAVAIIVGIPYDARWTLRRAGPQDPVAGPRPRTRYGNTHPDRGRVIHVPRGRIRAAPS